jgi:single-strand DNA-binding protein
MASELRFPNVNQVTISGRITRDLELRHTPSGTKVIVLPIAFSRTFRDNSGEFQEQTSFIDIKVWSNRAEDCAKYLHKGSPVIVEGYLQTRTYENKEGQNVKAVEIVANRVHFLEWNRRDGAESSEPRTQESHDSQPTDDDVPF